MFLLPDEDLVCSKHCDYIHVLWKQMKQCAGFFNSLLTWFDPKELCEKSPAVGSVKTHFLYASHHNIIAKPAWTRCRIKPVSFISWSAPDVVISWSAPYVVDIQNEPLQGVWSSEVRHGHRGFGAEPDRLAHMLIFMWKNTGKMELSSLRRSLALLQTVYSLQTVSSVDATFAPDFSSQACTVTSSVNVTCEDRMKGMIWFSFEQITSDECSCSTIMSFVCFSASKRLRNSIKVRLSSPTGVIALYFLSEQAGTDVNLRHNARDSVCLLIWASVTTVYLKHILAEAFI